MLLFTILQGQRLDAFAIMIHIYYHKFVHKPFHIHNNIYRTYYIYLILYLYYTTTDLCILIRQSALGEVLCNHFISLSNGH